MHDDRHGRLRHGTADPRRRPPGGYRARDRRRFRQFLDDALVGLPSEAATALDGATVEVVDVPDVAPDPDPPPAAVPLVGADAAGPRVRRLVVYRRPVELRAADRDDLVELLRAAVLDAVADALGTDPDAWDGA